MTGALLFTHFYLNSDSRQTSLELFFLSHMVEEFSEKTSDAKEHFDFINTTFESFPYQGCFPQWFSACFFCVSTALGWRTGLLQAEIAPEIDQFQGPSIQRLMLDMCPHVVPLLAWCQWRRSDLISLWSAAQKERDFFSAFSRGFFVWFTLGQFVTPFIIPQNPFPPKKNLVTLWNLNYQCWGHDVLPLRGRGVNVVPWVLVLYIQHRHDHLCTFSRDKMEIHGIAIKMYVYI